MLSERAAEELGADELDVVLAHELGHVLFDHVFLSSLMGGVLHPAGVGVLWGLVFARWRRFAEQTADRISLLVCGEVEVVVRTLIKVVYGVTDRVVDVRTVLRRLYDGEHPEDGRRIGGLAPARSLLMARIRAVVDFDAELVALDVERWLTVDR
jgi:Zn-dependent protease with chaperone function